jgi:hypothetical protein
LLSLAIGGLIASLLALTGWSGIFNSGSNKTVGTGERRGADAAPAQPETPRPVAPPAPNKPSETVPKAPDRSPEFNRLVELRAYAIWVDMGRPEGQAGDRVKDENWHKAERQIETEVTQRAFTIWVKQGRPEGAAGAAVRDKNMRTAEAELLEETEDDLIRHPLD